MATHFDSPAAYADASFEAHALLQALNSELLSHDNATLTLERWCDNHRLASSAGIVAERIHGAEKPTTIEQRRLLSARIRSERNRPL